MTQQRVPVLIVGSGLSGLTTAVMLAWHGIPPLLVERRAGTSKNPRARGVNFRSMELLRVAGLEPDLLAAGGQPFESFSIIIAETVTGRELHTLLPPGGLSAAGESGTVDGAGVARGTSAGRAFDTRSLSPAVASAAGQERVEPILRRHAEALGADLRYATELAGFEQDADGVTAVLRDCASGAEQSVRADYLVAADGHRSPIRARLGVGARGYGTLSHNVAVVFEGDLDPVIGRGRLALYYLRNPRFTGVFVNTDDPNRAIAGIEYDPARASPADFDERRALEIVRDVLGLPRFDARILEIQTFEFSSRVADELSRGRVFLVGDAAHTMPPTGGLGGQTAIQDGYDIAWKLAMVLHGRAGPALLATYAAERKPVAEMTVARQLANYVERMRPDRAEIMREAARLPAGALPDYLSVAGGYCCRSAAILSETPDDGALAESPFSASGRPGTRAPHVPFVLRGVPLSSLDLIGREFVLVCGPDGAAWARAAVPFVSGGALPLAVYRVGAELRDPDGRSFARFGVEASGAVLLRPDGLIAWRARNLESARECGCDARAVLEQVLARVLCRSVESLRARVSSGAVAA